VPLHLKPSEGISKRLDTVESKGTHLFRCVRLNLLGVFKSFEIFLTEFVIGTPIILLNAKVNHIA
jgi:hypothetical protein